MVDKRYVLGLLMLLGVGLNAAATEKTIQEKNKARLDEIYQAFNNNKLTATTAKADSGLLQDHVKALRVEQELLNGFVSRSLKPGLYKAGGYGAGLVFGSLTGAIIGAGGYLIAQEGLNEFASGLMNLAGGIGRGYVERASFKLALSPEQRLMGITILSSPLLAILAGMGMERMFKWAYQYNQKRGERLKAIEENIKLDEAIIAQLDGLVKTSAK